MSPYLSPLSALVLLLLLTGCAPGPYNPDGMAAGVSMMQSGVQMMQPQYRAPQQSSCHWFGSQWVCQSW